jgi:hypothetical protein
MVDPNHHRTDPECEGDPGRRTPTRQEWERVPSDPDLHDDLGYELLDLEIHKTNEDRLIFLPKDEDMIREAAFIVTREDDLHSPR